MRVLAQVLLLATLAAPPAANPHLEEGIDLYRAEKYATALEALTRAVDHPSSRHDAARVHLYIGLIQLRFGLAKDAADSFTKALEYDPKVALPKNAPKEALKLMRRLAPREPKEPAKEPQKEPAKEPSAPAPAPPGQPEAQPPPPAEPPLPPPPPPAATPPRPQLVQPSLPPERGPNLPAWVSAGAAAAAITGGVILTITAASTNAEAIDEPVGSRSEALHESAVSQQRLSFVSFAVGAAAAGLAGYFFLEDED